MKKGHDLLKNLLRLLTYQECLPDVTSGKHSISGYVNSFKRFSVYQSCVEYPKPKVVLVVIILLICIPSMIVRVKKILTVK